MRRAACRAPPPRAPSTTPTRTRSRPGPGAGAGRAVRAPTASRSWWRRWRRRRRCSSSRTRCASTSRCPSSRPSRCCRRRCLPTVSQAGWRADGHATEARNWSPQPVPLTRATQPTPPILQSMPQATPSSPRPQRAPPTQLLSPADFVNCHNPRAPNRCLQPTPPTRAARSQPTPPSYVPNPHPWPVLPTRGVEPARCADRAAEGGWWPGAQRPAAEDEDCRGDVENPRAALRSDRRREYILCMYDYSNINCVTQT